MSEAVERESASRSRVSPVGKDADSRNGPTADPIQRLQSTAGNRVVVQRLATVGNSDDPAEREADGVADHLIRSTGRTPASPPPTTRIRRGHTAGFAVDRSTESRIVAARGSGRPLPNPVRTKMESSFGVDLSPVRLHDDQRAHTLSRDISAKAFTTGSDIFFGKGEYQPSSADGQRTLAHELTHVVQQGGTVGRVQRKTLSADEILSALERIDFVKKKLKSTIDAKRTEMKLPASMRAQVKDVLDQYDTHVAAGRRDTHAQAMRLAMTLEAVAKVIAYNELNDPAMAPQLATKLLELYRSEIEQTLSASKMHNQDETLQVAGALISDDPYMLYMHDELRLELAADRIRAMATKAKRTPEWMLDMLDDRFQAQMAVHSPATLATDAVTAYSIRESTGEISTKWFTATFGSTAQPQWHNAANGRDVLEYTDAAESKYKAIRSEVTTPTPNSAVTAAPGLTDGQTAHLDSALADDVAVLQAGTIDGQVDAALQTALGLSANQAATARQAVKTGLMKMPLTLTVQGVNWFGSGIPQSSNGEVAYRPGRTRGQATAYSDLLDKPGAQGSIDHIGAFDDQTGQSRGENYNRFRAWKDQRMTGNRELSQQEMPSFAAVNLNWDAHGTDDPKDSDRYGVNSYGDVHFVLDRSKVGHRCVYTATDHGRPHRDPYLAFCDFLLGGDGITGLKDTKHLQTVGHIVNSCLTKRAIGAGTQRFEVQIFGTLDILRDVEQIYAASSVNPAVRANLKKFCKKYGKPGSFVQYIPKPKQTLEMEAYTVRVAGSGNANLKDDLQNHLT